MIFFKLLYTLYVGYFCKTSYKKLFKFSTKPYIMEKVVIFRHSFCVFAPFTQLK